MLFVYIVLRKKRLSYTQCYTQFSLKGWNGRGWGRGQRVICHPMSSDPYVKRLSKRRKLTQASDPKRMLVQNYGHLQIKLITLI